MKTNEGNSRDRERKMMLKKRKTKANRLVLQSPTIDSIYLFKKNQSAFLEIKIPRIGTNLIISKEMVAKKNVKKSNKQKEKS